MSKISETVGDITPLPVTIRGEDAGRQVRGSASVRKSAVLADTQEIAVEGDVAGRTIGSGETHVT